MCTHLLRTLLLACSLAWFTPGEVRAEEQASFNFDWVGSLELDTGFAAYSFELETDPSEAFLDYRGHYHQR